MHTPSAKPSELQRAWFVVDAEGQVLGRLASRVASVLRGKNRPYFTPNLDTGDFVVVVNAEKIKVTGKKELDKEYLRYTGYYGNDRKATVEHVRNTHPERLVSTAVKGMLPKGPLGRKMLTKLRVYAGPQHPHSAQKPVALP
jgi:large subunit ribosomal protein L13